jgi:glycosyltransferase involved in cell wall biosynthesis
MDERQYILIQEFMNSHSKRLSFAILVATRNRPDALDRLLDSIHELVIRPEVLVIVSSGMDVTHIIEKHHKLAIKHKHILERGQIRQKILGISVIPKKVDWVLFLDDDLVLEPTATLNLFGFLSNNQDAFSAIGLGLSDASKNNTKRSRLSAISKAGKVSKSGKNFDYMFSRVPIQTSWLNGASMWRRDHVDNYFFEYLESPYSICEDLIFSYSRSKYGNLYFIPEARFNFQSHVKPVVNNFEIFRARAYWKYYFVSINPDLSVFLFLINQLLATFAFVIRGNVKTQMIPYKLKFSLVILLDLIISYLKRRNPHELMKLRKV